MNRLALIALLLAACADDGMEQPIEPATESFDLVDCAPALSGITKCHRACADTAAIGSGSTKTCSNWQTTNSERLLDPGACNQQATDFDGIGGCCYSGRFDGSDEIHWAWCAD